MTYIYNIYISEGNMFAKKQKVLEDFFYHLAQERPALHANFYVSQIDLHIPQP